MQSIETLAAELAGYAVLKKIIPERDRRFALNALFELFGLAGSAPAEGFAGRKLGDILSDMLGYAVENKLCGPTVAEKDRFDTKIMGALMPSPSEIERKFRELYEQSPIKATDWFYKLCIDTNYIRSDRVALDEKWTVESEYGRLEISINLSKPEKDPAEIRAAGQKKEGAYPVCELCPENEGYPGRTGYPARQNLRLIDMELGGTPSALQYSPYSYFDEHCIILNKEHVPMVINQKTIEKLLEFVEKFPHYFIGSNADLPIVGGSVLSHDHFQAGRHAFPMDKAPVEKGLSFKGFENVSAGTLRWPMPVIRLASADRETLAALAGKIIEAWRNYDDPSAMIFSHTGDIRHSTITPISRKNGDNFELDLVLRNNITTPEHPAGLYHPHAEIHNIKRENIGLIEVMGLAILPPRLKPEMEGIAWAIETGRDISGITELQHHEKWFKRVVENNPGMNSENVRGILRQEVGLSFKRALEQGGVFRRDEAGKRALARFIESI